MLDPMMGGGTTLHEALRLGASVIGADVDPIPIVQARASLTQPRRLCSPLSGSYSLMPTSRAYKGRLCGKGAPFW